MSLLNRFLERTRPNWIRCLILAMLGIAVRFPAVRRQPDQPRQYFLLADVLEKLGRHEEAQVALAQVRSLQALAKSQSPASGVH